MGQHIDQLSRLADLLDRGLISQDEFDQQKRRLLAGGGASSEAEQDPGVMPDSGLVWAILATIFCFLPFGIVAIVKASQVSSMWASGQYELAYAAAEASRKWSLWSLITGLIVGVLYGLLVAAAS